MASGDDDSTAPINHAVSWFILGMAGFFVLVGLVSIKPTLVFLRWRKAVAANAEFRATEAEWRLVKRLVLLEMHLVALIPLFAVLMARGIGYGG